MPKYSGNYEGGGRDDDDDERPRKPRKRVRQIAEEFSVREVGNGDAVDDYIAKAEGIVKWRILTNLLKREGWEPDGEFQYTAHNNSTLYKAHRFIYAKYKKKKRYILTHTNGEGALVINAGPVRVPYNLPELLERPDDDIDLVEGETRGRVLQEARPAGHLRSRSELDRRRCRPVRRTQRQHQSGQRRRRT